MILSIEALRRRISRVQALVAYLDRLKPVELAAYKGDIALQLRIERVAQLLAQSLVDVGNSLLESKRANERLVSSGGNAPAIGGKASLMIALGDAGILESDLARRLADLPELADVLVHEFIECDPVAVWRIWHERRPDFAAAAAGFAAYITRNKVSLQS